MGRVGAVAVAKAVKVSRGLQRLELDDNQISEDGMDHLRVRSSIQAYIILDTALQRNAAAPHCKILGGS